MEDLEVDVIEIDNMNNDSFLGIDLENCEYFELADISIGSLGLTVEVHNESEAIAAGNLPTLPRDGTSVVEPAIIEDSVPRYIATPGIPDHEYVKDDPSVKPKPLYNNRSVAQDARIKGKAYTGFTRSKATGVYVVKQNKLHNKRTMGDRCNHTTVNLNQFDHTYVHKFLIQLGDHSWTIF
jgi:hypothetical protein